jgi:hypothetical protein
MMTSSGLVASKFCMCECLQNSSHVAAAATLGQGFRTHTHVAGALGRSQLWLRRSSRFLYVSSHGMRRSTGSLPQEAQKYRDLGSCVAAFHELDLAAGLRPSRYLSKLNFAIQGWLLQLRPRMFPRSVPSGPMPNRYPRSHPQGSPRQCLARTEHLPGPARHRTAAKARRKNGG